MHQLTEKCLEWHSNPSPAQPLDIIIREWLEKKARLLCIGWGTTMTNYNKPYEILGLTEKPSVKEAPKEKPVICECVEEVMDELPKNSTITHVDCPKHGVSGKKEAPADLPKWVKEYEKKSSEDLPESLEKVIDECQFNAHDYKGWLRKFASEIMRNK